MTIKQQGGIFGRNPTFNNADVDNNLNVGNNLNVSNNLDVDGAITTDGLTVNATTTTFEGSGDQILQLRTTNFSADNRIYFGRTGADTRGIIYFQHNGGKLRYDVDSNHIFTVTNASGFAMQRNVSFPSGYGIDFSATSDGSGTTTSELFDDYEEGTWTPTYTTDGTDFDSVTYDTQDGHYTKIGNVVVLRAYLRTDAITVGSASGNVVVGGLPFSAANSRNAGSVIPSAFIGDHPIMIQASGSIAYLYYQASASGTTSLLQIADLNTGANDNSITFTVTYQAS
jgi:hypothetical protein